MIGYTKEFEKWWDGQLTTISPEQSKKDTILLEAFKEIAFKGWLAGMNNVWLLQIKNDISF